MTAGRLLARLVRGESAEFVLGDLAEDAAARLRSGESPRFVRRWYRRQLLSSSIELLRDRFRGSARSGSGAGEAAAAGSGGGAGGGRLGRGRSGGSWTYAVSDALRHLRRSPGRAIAIVVILALGVGANATMFGTLDRLFFEPPAHIASPDDVKRVFVHLTRQSGEPGFQSTHPYADYRDWAALDEFDEVAAYAQLSLTEGSGASARRVSATLATASFFPLLGVRPEAGRFFGEEDDTFGAEPVAVLGYAYWQERFGGSLDAIGQSLYTGDLTYTIIGVAPPAFTGVDLERVDVWLPLHRAGVVEQGGTEWVDARGWYWVHAVARLAPGVSREAASAAALLAHQTGRAENDEYVERVQRVELASLILAQTDDAPAESRIVPWLMGVALMVLLLTCANVANLFLASALRRRRETAVRRALGAGRGRLLGSVIAESMLLAIVGGIAAVAVSFWVGDVFRATIFPGAGWETGPGALRVIAFSTALAVLAGLATGVVPAIRASATDPSDALRGTGRGTTRGRSRLRSGLLIVQAAISVLLLIGTGLFVRSLQAAHGIDLGFDADRVLIVQLEPEGGYPGGEAMVELYREARRELAGLPGSPRTTISTTVPFQNARGIGEDLRVPGLDSLPSTAAGGAYIHAVTSDYFDVIGTRVIRGRGISDADDQPTAPRVAVVSELMARLFWPDGDAIGRCLIIREAPCTTVVGVVEDQHRFDLDEPESMAYYVPLAYAPYPWPPRGLLIETPSAAALAPVVQRRLSGAMSGVRLVMTRPFRDVIDPAYRSWKLGATLFAGFGLLALIVASIGLYSVLAFDVAERRPEMGVRAALGATRQRIVRYVLADGLRLASAGIVLGVGVGLIAAWRAQPLLYGVSPRDPLVIAAVVLAMLVVSIAACGLPAWRAARVDPNETLRAE